MSTQTALNHTLSLMHNVHHKDVISDFETDNSHWGFWGTVCRVILLYEARVANSLFGNHRSVDWTAVLDLQQGVCVGLGPGLRHIRGPHITSYKCCLAFCQHNEYHKLITFP